ncbi:MAG: hypothetical protein DRI57_10870 [Deltaproteobacteria bacterium]|nr:MAG: hypothetical protein DRI57_10870 [Deltaproteobacteria bacterium]
MQKFRYSKAMLKQSHFCTPSAQTKQHIKKYTDEIITYNWIYRGEIKMKKFLLTMGLFLSIFYGTGFAQDTFVVGFPPFANAENFEEAFQPFTAYLSKTTGLPAKFVLFKSYEDFANAFVSGEISLGFFGATLYVQTKDKHPDKVHYLATCQKIAEYKKKKVRTHYYYSYFVVNANSPYKSLKDLKGKKWGFVKKSSSSGYQYPMSHFARKQIDPYKYFSEVKFLQKHPKVTDALAEWKSGADNIIDGGASSDKNLWLAEKKTWQGLPENRQSRPDSVSRPCCLSGSGAEQVAQG